jgi:hypothetical protein
MSIAKNAGSPTPNRKAVLLLTGNSLVSIAKEALLWSGCTAAIAFPFLKLLGNLAKQDLIASAGGSLIIFTILAAGGFIAYFSAFLMLFILEAVE